MGYEVKKPADSLEKGDLLVCKRSGRPYIFLGYDPNADMMHVTFHHGGNLPPVFFVTTWTIVRLPTLEERAEFRLLGTLEATRKE